MTEIDCVFIYELELENDLLLYKYILQYKSTIQRIHQWKNNIEMYHFINTFWTLIFCHVWRPFYDEYTSLLKGNLKNQGFNITIIMLANV